MQNQIAKFDNVKVEVSCLPRVCKVKDYLKG